MNKIFLPNLNIKLILLGGQTFSWTYHEPLYYGVFKKNLIKINYEKDHLFWQTYPEQDNFNLIEKYFDLSTEYKVIIDEISKDNNAKKAIKLLKEIRILRQDFYECLISFIISQNNNIPKIRNTIAKIRDKYGEKITIDHKYFSLFPEIEQLKNTNEIELQQCGAGYRSKYLVDAMNSITKEELTCSGKDFDKDRNNLLKIHGIGNKVADCILVFGLGYRNVTPIDLWAKRVMSQLYNVKLSKYTDLSQFIHTKFRNNTAFSGQYLFEYMRLLHKN